LWWLWGLWWCCRWWCGITVGDGCITVGVCGGINTIGFGVVVVVVVVGVTVGVFRGGGGFSVGGGVVTVGGVVFKIAGFCCTYSSNFAVRN